MPGTTQAVSKNDSAGKPQRDGPRDRAGLGGSTPQRPSRHRGRRWSIWIAAILAGIVVITAGAVAAFVEFGPTFRPLTLPAVAVPAPAGAQSGTWLVSSGSLAGFRVQETAIGASSYVGGTTKAITGTIVISGNTVTAATLRVNIGEIKVNGKPQPQFAASLNTRIHPIATFTLSRPVALAKAFASGGTVMTSAAGRLSMNGIEHAVTVTITARRSGTELQAAGSIPITFAPWRITQPTGFGFLGSLANHGTAEFVIILHRR